VVNTGQTGQTVGLLENDMDKLVHPKALTHRDKNVTAELV
jgi:hypothetical protein